MRVICRRGVLAYVEISVKETVAALLLIVYGLAIGLLMGPAIAVDTTAWAATATVVRDFTAAIGICIGGIWAYGKYLRSREGELRTQLSHVVTSVELENFLLLRIQLEIKNTGPVVVRPSNAYMLVQSPPTLPADGSKDPSTAWVTVHRLDFNFVKDELCIEPGDAVRYSRDVTLQATTRYVQIHSHADLGEDSWYADETSVHKLTPTAAVAERKSE